MPAQKTLSIPFWSDFIHKNKNRRNRQNNCFQSHFGLILSYFVVYSYLYVFALSIPFWSDFILRNTGKERQLDFQSHFGLILSSSIGNHHSDVHFFQSHFGLILSKSWDIIILPSCHTFNPILVWFYRSISTNSRFVNFIFQSHFGLILSLFIS